MANCDAAWFHKGFPQSQSETKRAKRLFRCCGRALPQHVCEDEAVTVAVSRLFFLKFKMTILIGPTLEKLNCVVRKQKTYIHTAQETFTANCVFQILICSRHMSLS